MEGASHIRLDVFGISGDARIDVALKVSGKTVTVRHQESMAYGGLLSQNLARPLIEISKQHRVTLAAFIMKPTGGKDDQKVAHPCQLYITVYGMQEAGRDVGEVLDQAGIFLQHPSSYDPAVPYINPHYLVRPGGTHPAPTSEGQIEISIRPSPCLSTDQRLKTNVSQMLNDSAKGPLNYSKYTPSTRIRTPLKL